MRLYVVVLVALLSLNWRPSEALPIAAVRAEDVVSIEARRLPMFVGKTPSSIAVVGCTEGRCARLPMQIDERSQDRGWVLDHGPEASADDPPDSFDDDDVLLFMAADAGERTAPAQLPGYEIGAEVAIRDPRDGARRWVYVLATVAPMPPSAESYVGYDPDNDRIHGADVSMGFRGGVPSYLALDDGPNLLDRLKVRASARLLFGLLSFSRSEEDLSTEFGGWHEGAIRVIRRQRQRIRLGWGIRSPTFGSYTYFYRAAADLPVGLHLNHAATYFVSDVEIRAILDFQNLSGWQVLVPGLPSAITVGGGMDESKQAMNHLEASWFALRGPKLTLVQSMVVSPSLDSTRRRLIYREGAQAIESPETVAGEEPGVGYSLDRWEQVAAGQHSFAAISYALPNQVDVQEFMAARQQPLRVSIEEIAPSASR